MVLNDKVLDDFFDKTIDTHKEPLEKLIKGKEPIEEDAIAYKNFLQEKIVTDNGLTGCFKEEGKQLYIISDSGFKIPFNIIFHKEYYMPLLEAAKQRLFAESIINK